MIARATIRLGGITENMASRDLDDYTVVEVTGEGIDWEAAKAAVKIEPGAELLYWVREA